MLDFVTDVSENSPNNFWTSQFFSDSGSSIFKPNFCGVINKTAMRLATLNLYDMNRKSKYR